MGFLKNTQKQMADNVYASVKEQLVERDGYVHVVMVKNFSKLLSTMTFMCDDKYSMQIDGILTQMQIDGYEIVDVKFNSLSGQGMTGQNEAFHTLILYK